jgi:hypothetical protein
MIGPGVKKIAWKLSAAFVERIRFHILWDDFFTNLLCLMMLVGDSAIVCEGLEHNLSVIRLIL